MNRDELGERQISYRKQAVPKSELQWVEARENAATSVESTYTKAARAEDSIRSRS